MEISAILDERWKEDDAVLIVKAPTKTGEVKSVRGALREVDMLLEDLWIGTLNVEECGFQLAS